MRAFARSLRLSGTLVALLLAAACGKSMKTEAVKPAVLLQPVHCVAVLPFENLTTYPRAGEIVADFFASELYSTEHFRILDRMEAQQAARRINLRIPERISAEQAREFGERMGVDGVFYGSVSEYWYPNTSGTEVSEQVRMGDEPAVGVSARLIATDTGELLWSASASRSSYDFLSDRRDPLSRVTQMVLRNMVSLLRKELEERQVEMLAPCGGKPAPLEGRFHGRVLSGGTEKPVAKAAMMINEPKELPVEVNPTSGEFLTPPIPAGVARFTVAADGYESYGGQIEILSNENISHDVSLEPRTREAPKPAGPRPGVVGGRVVSVTGQPMAATIKFDPDPGFGAVTSDPQTGRFQKEVPAGVYTAVIAANDYKPREKIIRLREGQNYFMEVGLEPVQLVKKTVQLEKDRITLTDQIHFETGSAHIREESFPILREVAEILKANPQITKVQIEGHTDDRGGALANQRLSQGRAESVREFLVQEGVGGNRLTALGFGEAVPIADNATAEGRARNRRVEFTILERQ